VRSHRKVFLLSHRTVPNEAGDHRAARTVPLGRGRFVCDPPTRGPHKYNGQYGPGYISVMTPGDPLPPPSRHIEPPFSVGEVRAIEFGRLWKNHPPRGGFFDAFHGPPPDGGASRRRAMVSWWSSS
jgi:hypothetical protein